MAHLEDALKADFRKFLWYLWTQVLGLPVPTRLQYDIAHFLQFGEKRRFIMAFRGIGKSWITSAYVLWRLWKNPNLRVMIVSANEKKALEIATFIRRLIDQAPVLHCLKPGPDHRDSVKAFDVNGSQSDIAPSVRVDGIFGQLTGGRADIILSDDVEVPKNSETEAMREKLEDRTREYSAIIKPLESSEIIYLGTPQSQESIYRRLAEKGYQIRVWPARYPFQKNMARYNGNLAPILLKDIEENPKLQQQCGSLCGGAPTDTRFDHLDLLEREQEYREAGFYLQFMLDTRLTDLDRYPLKMRNLIVMDLDKKVAPVQLTWASGRQQTIEEIPNVGFDGDRCNAPLYMSPDFIPYTGSVMVIDPAGRGRDETAYAISRFLNGMIFITRTGGLRGGYSEETLNALALIAKEEEVGLIRIEDNFGDGMYTQLLRPVLLQNDVKASLEEYHSSGQKELRILQKLEAPVTNHRVVVDKNVILRDIEHTDQNEYRLFYQFTHLTPQKGALKHDDRLEVLAEAVGYWTDRLHVANNDAEKKRRERLRDLEWERACRKSFGFTSRRKPRYFKRSI